MRFGYIVWKQLYKDPSSFPRGTNNPKLLIVQLTVICQGSWQHCVCYRKIDSLVTTSLGMGFYKTTFKEWRHLKGFTFFMNNACLADTRYIISNIWGVWDKDKRGGGEGRRKWRKFNPLWTADNFMPQRKNKNKILLQYIGKLMLKSWRETRFSFFSLFWEGSVEILCFL